MTEDQLFAKIGRLQCKSEIQDGAYTRLLEVLAGVVGGAIDRTRVLVNVTERSWAVSEPGTSPARPAQVNGLPEVVVAPVLDERAVLRLRVQELEAEVKDLRERPAVVTLPPSTLFPLPLLDLDPDAPREHPRPEPIEEPVPF